MKFRIFVEFSILVNIKKERIDKKGIAFTHM